jgi:alpha-tubulin suppressor-like RCC1 family protein
VSTARLLHPIAVTVRRGADRQVGDRPADGASKNVTLRCSSRHALIAALIAFAMTTFGASVAAQSAQLPSFRVVDAGDDFTCALTTDGRAFCWGANDFGQLGTPRAGAQCSDAQGPGDCSPFPISVAGDIRFATLATGKTHACGIDFDGVAWCWGMNAAGQVGSGNGTGGCRPRNGDAAYRPVACSLEPQRVPTGVRFVAIGAGDEISCALGQHASVWCWGGGENHATPTQVPIDLPLKSIAVGGDRACGLTYPQGMLRCWWWPAVLHDGFVTPGGSRRWSVVAVATAHGCAIDADAATVACWGNDADGALGRGRRDHRLFGEDSIAPIASQSEFRTITVSATESCGVDSENVLECWGRLGPRAADDECLGSNGYAGSNSCTSTPRLIEPHRRFLGVTLGDQHGCGLLATRETVCWGSNDWGQLGDGTRLTAARFTPLAAADRSGDPAVWVREHWSTRGALVVLGLSLVMWMLLATMPRWRPVLIASADRVVPHDPGGFLSIAIVVSGWVLPWLAISTGNKTGGGDVGLGLAMLAILLSGVVCCCLALVGGIVATVTLRRNPKLRAAWAGLALAALSLLAVAVAFVHFA